MGSRIKIHQVSKDIKALDKTITGIERIRQASIATKDSGERAQIRERENPVKYAEDSIYRGADGILCETAGQMRRQVGRTAEIAQRCNGPSQKTKPPRSGVPDSDAPPNQPKDQTDKAQAQAKKKAAAQKVNPKDIATAREQPKPTIKTLERAEKMPRGAKTIKSTDKSVKTLQYTMKSARTKAKAVGKAAEKMRIAAQKAAQTTKAIAKKTAAAVRAVYRVTRTFLTILVVMGWAVVLILLVVILFGAVLCMMGDGSTGETIQMSAEVAAYEPVIWKYAEENGTSEYTELIKAVMMQESGGRGNDPMQCSECGYNTEYPREPGGITDPEYSIQCGVQELKACLQSAQVESPIDMERIPLALQGYNFGRGYITWAQDNYGGYTLENAEEFSEEMAESLGWDNYGDCQYVPHVLRYYIFGRGQIGEAH